MWDTLINLHRCLQANFAKSSQSLSCNLYCACSSAQTYLPSPGSCSSCISLVSVGASHVSRHQAFKTWFVTWNMLSSTVLQKQLFADELANLKLVWIKLQCSYFCEIHELWITSFSTLFLWLQYRHTLTWQYSAAFWYK